MIIINDRDFAHHNDLGQMEPVFSGEYLCSWYEDDSKREKYFSEDSLKLYDPKSDILK